jgi:hypothetical protein
MNSLAFKAHYEQNRDPPGAAWLEQMCTSQNVFGNSEVVCMAYNFGLH